MENSYSSIFVNGGLKTDNSRRNKTKPFFWTALDLLGALNVLTLSESPEDILQAPQIEGLSSTYKKIKCLKRILFWILFSGSLAYYVVSVVLYGLCFTHRTECDDSLCFVGFTNSVTIIPAALWKVCSYCGNLSQLLSGVKQQPPRRANRATVTKRGNRRFTRMKFLHATTAVQQLIFFVYYMRFVQGGVIAPCRIGPQPANCGETGRMVFGSLETNQTLQDAFPNHTVCTETLAKLPIFNFVLFFTFGVLTTVLTASAKDKGGGRRDREDEDEDDEEILKQAVSSSLWAAHDYCAL